jgi:hypothetical protein
MRARKYELQENEKWSGKAKGGFREVETIVEAGLSNDYHQRDEFNVKFFQGFQDNIPKWPWLFKRTAVRGFGLG